MDQIDLLRQVVSVLEDLGIPYMVVGSLACAAYGEPRMTLDIDMVVDLKPQQVAPLCQRFPPEEFYVSAEAALQAVRTRGQFNIIHSLSGNKVDLRVVSASTWGRLELSRRQKVAILPDLQGYCARPEDIIIGKLNYYREGKSDKHLRDIMGILKVSGDSIDRQYILQWAEQMHLADIWQGVLRKLNS